MDDFSQTVLAGGATFLLLFLPTPHRPQGALQPTALQGFRRTSPYSKLPIFHSKVSKYSII